MKRYTVANRKTRYDEKPPRQVWLVVLILFALVVLSFLIYWLIGNVFSNTKTPDKEIEIGNTGIQVIDDDGTWNTYTEIQFFKTSYKNGEAYTVVAGNNSDRLIAPGTANTYSLQLVNSGKEKIDYEMFVKFEQSEGWKDIEVPIKVKLEDSSGNTLLDNGDWTSWTDAPDVSKGGSLFQNRSNEYVLSWEWPYETEHDDADTWLGNLAAENGDLVLTLNIEIKAKQDVQQTEKKSYDFLWWLLPSILLLVILIIIMLLMKRDKNDYYSSNS